MTLPGDDPRGLGFGYGALLCSGYPGRLCHSGLFAVLSFQEALYPGLNTRLLGDESACKPVTVNSKPYMVYYEENQKATTDCLNVCCFTTHWSYAVLTPDQVEYLNVSNRS